MQALVWLGVMVVTSPIYLASARKIQAMSMLVAEICVPMAASGQHGAAARTVIGQVFVLVSFVLMTVLTLLLSTSILGLAREHACRCCCWSRSRRLLFRPMLVRIYSRAEIALHETLIELPPAAPGAAQGDAGAAARGGTGDDGNSCRLAP